MEISPWERGCTIRRSTLANVPRAPLSTARSGTRGRPPIHQAARRYGAAKLPTESPQASQDLPPPPLRVAHWRVLVVKIVAKAWSRR